MSNEPEIVAAPAVDPIDKSVLHVIARTYDEAVHWAHAKAQELGSHLTWRHIPTDDAALRVAAHQAGADTVIVEPPKEV